MENFYQEISIFIRMNGLLFIWHINAFKKFLNEERWKWITYIKQANAIVNEDAVKESINAFFIE